MSTLCPSRVKFIYSARKCKIPKFVFHLLALLSALCLGKLYFKSITHLPLLIFKCFTNVDVLLLSVVCCVKIEL